MTTFHLRPDERNDRRRLFPSRRKRVQPTRFGHAIGIEELEHRLCPSSAAGLTSSASDLRADPNVSLVGHFEGNGAINLYRFSADTEGLFVAQVRAAGFDTRLSLLGGQGQLLIQSEAASTGDLDNRVAMHLSSGNYFLMVQDVTGGGAYTLGISFTDAAAPARPLAGNSAAYSVAVANLTGNAIPDLIVADLYVDQVLVYMGAGDGTFEPPIALPVGGDPVFVTTADLTGNGIPDIITANLGSNDVSILVGNGDGTFQPAINVPAGPGASSVAVGDYNGDGHPDLAVTNSYGEDVQVLLGRGDGTFGQGAMISTDPAPWSVVAADFNRDGRTDLAVVSIATSSLMILEGKGDGTFAEVQQLSTGPLCLSVIAADFNGDGLLDLAVACANNDTVEMFENDDGRFVASTVIHTPSDPFALAAADFNDDGRTDLAVTSYGVGGVSIFPGNGDGTFQPEMKISVGPSTTGIAAADLSGDGRVDLVTSNLIDETIDVLVGNGDGTFHAPAPPAATTSPADVVAADLTGNGIQDLIIPDESTNEVSILLGRGDGSFLAPILIPVGKGPSSVVVGDFNGDGVPDLAVTNGIDDSVWILMGTGNGSFVRGEELDTGIQPFYIATADLTGDGHLDLVVSNFYSSSISIYYSNGDGTFQSQVVLPLGNLPGNPVIADFNGDGRPDIAVANSQHLITVFLATGPEAFDQLPSIPAGPGANRLAAGDLTGDGKIDLVVADSNLSGPSYVTVLLGRGDGNFTTGQTIPVGADPTSLSVADVSGLGKLDIVIGYAGGNDLALLKGRGDGTFLATVTLPSGPLAFALAVADFNGDHRPDIAVADHQSGNVTVLLNLGDGSFAPPDQLSTGFSAVATVSADFSDDGRIDMAVADPLKNTVTILLGNGDGTFSAGQALSVGIDPRGLVAGDFNGDGRADLAVADAGSDNVMVFLGLGDGTFGSPIVLPVGAAPTAIVIGHFLKNGIDDIAVADELSNDVAVLIGRGNGTFLPVQRYNVGKEPVALAAGDLFGDGYIDLVTANRTSGDITILSGLAGGNFAPQTYQYGGHAPTALAIADYNGDGRLDLAVADEDDDTVSVLVNQGGRKFAHPLSLDIGQAADFLGAAPLGGGRSSFVLFAAGLGSTRVVILRLDSNGDLLERETVALATQPTSLVLGDFDRDGIVDIAFATSSSDSIDVQIGTGDGQFVATDANDAAPLPQAAPIVIDWNRDGVPDVFDLDEQGDLLSRLGQPGSPGQYESTQIIGQSLGVTFSDIAMVKTANEPVLAALEQGQPVIWLFSHAVGPGDLIAARSISVQGAGFLVSMLAGDLDNDGRVDLVLVDRGNDQLIRLYQAPDGSFIEEGPALHVGYAPSEVAIASLNKSGWPDLLVSNTYSGDISIFYGEPGRQFDTEVLLAAGLGAAVALSQDGGLVPHTNDDPLGVTAGVFDGAGLADVVSVQSGADRISLLEGTPDGELADPSLATSYSTGVDPTQVVAAPLTESGLTDLVVLNEGSQNISIFLNNGNGGFITMPLVDAGNDPTGVAVRDVNGDGISDLLVSNKQGDLLIILGNGNGTFKPYERADQTVSLAVGDFNNNGLPEFVLSNTSLDQLSIQYGATQSFVQGRSQGIQAPGAVAVADLNGDGNPDIIVVNKGQNDILVYLGLGGNRFEAPLVFSTGTDPVGLTVGDLAGNGIPDLIVANAGSNDLSIFIGAGRGTTWYLEAGPRLRVGDEPVSTTVADLSANGIPDIISVDQGSDNVVVLRGIGGGFFADSDPLKLSTGQGPIRAFVGNFDAAPGADLAVIDSGSNNLAYYSNFLGARSTLAYIPTGGVGPIAAVMGDYNQDGYNDLVIANNADDRITLLEGGPQGLVLSSSEILDQPIRPTDLVISATDPGQLHLDISAAGQNQVIPVILTLALGTTGLVPAAGNPSAQPASSQTGASKGFLISGNGLASFDLLSAETDSQEQALVQAVTLSSGPTAASSQGAVAIATIVSTLPPMINPSLGSLPGVINSLMQLSQVQISDIMPLENSAMDAVAVLLVVSKTSNDDATSNDSESPGESQRRNGLEVKLALSRQPEFPGSGSNLERFLADLESALISVPLDDLGLSAQPSGDWSQWALQPSTSDTIAMTIAGPGGLIGTTASTNPSPAPKCASPPITGTDIDFSELARFDWRDTEPSSTNEAASSDLGWTGPFCGMVVISAIVVGSKAARKRFATCRPQPTVRRMPVITGPHTTNRLKASRSLGSKASRFQDRPPWLAGPT
jgi:hypothetical protein